MAQDHQTATWREKFFRGIALEDLKKMGTREFAALLASRERRTVMRNFNVIEEFVRRAEKRTAKGKIPRTHKRSLVIVPAMVGMTIGIHNGKEFNQVRIVEEMLGHRLGEFAITRRFVRHGAAGVGATKSSSSLSVK